MSYHNKENVCPNPKVDVAEILDQNDLLIDAFSREATTEIAIIANYMDLHTIPESNKNCDNVFLDETEIIIEEPGISCKESKSLSETDEESVENQRIRKKKRKYKKRQRIKLTSEEKKKILIQNDLQEHPVLPGCDLKCSKKCSKLFNEFNRRTINTEYWNLEYKSKRTFIQERIEKYEPCRKTTGSESRRNNTLKYSLKHPGSGECLAVCKSFFLTTLGLKKTNDKFLQNALRECNTKREIYKNKRTCEKITKADIINFIEAYNPAISHYRREHAPNKRYLPSDISIKALYAEFLRTHKQAACSYESFRKIIKKDLNISFTKLGNEECEQCIAFELHKIVHKPKEYSPENATKTDEASNYEERTKISIVDGCSIMPNEKDRESNNERYVTDNCDQRNSWRKHIQFAKEARLNYRTDSESRKWDCQHVCFSVDLQKIIMLPRMESLKQVMFTKRLIAFNESMVPVGRNQKSIKPHAILWHEATAGRKMENITSTFYSFFFKS